MLLNWKKWNLFQKKRTGNYFWGSCFFTSQLMLHIDVWISEEEEDKILKNQMIRIQNYGKEGCI